MKGGLLEAVKSRGYWRINFRPLVFVENSLTMAQCKEFVERNSVELRGWDYPHFPQRNDESQGIMPAGAYFEGWTEWDIHIEFWRMYRSSQFLHYLALREDWFERSSWLGDEFKTSPGTSLGVIGTIYQVTEIFQFLSRLVSDGLYADGVSLSVSLNSTAGRSLRVDDSRRVPFSYERKTGAPSIFIDRRLTSAEVISETTRLTVDAVLELFDNFGWNPSREIIEVEHLRLLERRV